MNNPSLLSVIISHLVVHWKFENQRQCALAKTGVLNFLILDNLISKNNIHYNLILIYQSLFNHLHLLKSICRAETDIFISIPIFFQLGCCFLLSRNCSYSRNDSFYYINYILYIVSTVHIVEISRNCLYIPLGLW